jgi:hypothetical protein
MAHSVSLSRYHFAPGEAASISPASKGGAIDLMAELVRIAVDESSSEQREIRTWRAPVMLPVFVASSVLGWLVILVGVHLLF